MKIVNKLKLQYISNKSGIISRLFKIFLYMIIIPTISIWMIYLLVLDNFFAKNTLSVQQTYLENSISSLNLSISNASTIFNALEGIPEFTYYLDFYSKKSDMLYSLKKTIQQQCTVLEESNSTIETINIYSRNNDLLFADPFHSIDELPLTEAETELLDNSMASDILWKIVPTKEINSLPELYAYQKLYAYNYKTVLGYKEIKINPQILESFVKQFENNESLHNGKFALYYNNQLMYSLYDSSLLPTEEELMYFSEDAYLINSYENQYINYVTIPDLNMQLVLVGSMSDLSSTPNNSLTMVITVFVVILLFLFSWFFRSVANLSRQIMDFSKHIRTSDPDNLQIYTIGEKQYREEYEELLHLINSYNSLIRENSTLMSQVRKMELLSQDASYQALQSQIHPHFIYGTLENIRMLALQNRDKAVADMIFSLSTLLRHSLSISSKAVTLHDEIEISRHYLNIQQVRLGNRFSYTFEVEEDLLSLQLPSFTLQPILENSILYGVSKTFDSCDLQVLGYSNSTHIYLELSNSGMFIERQRLTEINELLQGKRELSDFQGTHNGFALYNIKERLQILFNKKATIHMALQDNRTKTIICIERSGIHVSDFDC